MHHIQHSPDSTAIAPKSPLHPGHQKKICACKIRIPAAILLALTVLVPRAEAQFELEESHTTASLRGVDNVGIGTVWASGTHGTVLRSEDDGFLWQNCTIPPGAENLDFRGIQAWDANTAIVMSSGKGDQSRLYKTTDGCQTWKLLFTNPDKDGFWDAIQFAKGNTQQERCFGVIVGDPVDGHFPTFLSFDCGNHWEKQIRESPPANPKGEGLFAASNSSLGVSGLHSREFITGGLGGPRLLQFWAGTDDTDTPDPIKVLPGAKPFHPFRRGWDIDLLPSTNPSESSGAFSLARNVQGFTVDTTVIVGGDYRKPDATEGTAWFCGRYDPKLKTNWQSSKTPPHGYRSAVAWDTEQKLWVTVGPNGTDISTDDGKNWRPLSPSGYDAPDTDKNWNALSLPFVVGSNGRIGRLRPINEPQTKPQPKSGKP
jgi:hypothetical protein